MPRGAHLYAPFWWCAHDIWSNLQRKTANHKLLLTDAVPRYTIRYSPLNHIGISDTVLFCTAQLCDCSTGYKVLVVSCHVAMRTSYIMQVYVCCCLVPCCSRGRGGTDTARFSGLILFHMWRCYLVCLGCYLFSCDGFLLNDCNINIQKWQFYKQRFLFLMTMFWIQPLTQRCITDCYEYLP